MTYNWDEFLLTMIGHIAWPTAFVVGVCLLTRRLDAYSKKSEQNKNKDVKPIPPGVVGFNPTLGWRGREFDSKWKAH